MSERAPERVRRAGRAAVVLLVAGLVACSGSPRKPERLAARDYGYARDYLTWFIEKRMAAEEVTGLSIALVDDQEIVWSRGFGWADKEAGRAVTGRTLFRIGSITKLFTAVAVMQLVERGEVELDAPLERYVPDFCIGSRFPKTGPITVRQLLTHHAGLPSNYLERLLTRDPPPMATIVESLRSEQLAFPPGLLWAYSNIGFELLGVLVERVSGLSYAEYVRRNILEPLGMREASFEQDFARLPGMSRGYRDHEAHPLYGLRALAAGGLNAGAEELALFVQMIFADGAGRGGRVLRPETLAEMLERQNALNPFDLDFAVGLAFNLGSSKLAYAGPAASHTGGIVYFRSILVAMPEQRLGVVVLANSNNADKRDVLGEIAVKALQLAVEAKFGVAPPEPEDEHVPAVEVPAVERRELVGQWATAVGAMRIEPDGAGLVARVMGRPLELVRHPDATWSVRYRLLGLLPIAPSLLGELRLGFPRIQGQRLLAARYKGNWVLAGSPVAPYRISPAWRERLGRYEIANLADGELALLEDISLEERGGVLLLKMRQTPYSDLPQIASVLRPLSDEQAVVEGMSGLGQTSGLVVVANGDGQLRLAGYRLQRVAGQR
ncbi:MAG: serine hydrolase domain-containing protein [Myxococcales bacterium]|jgi:CubicO group peptidase (beta-lactamase class C family)